MMASEPKKLRSVLVPSALRAELTAAPTDALVCVRPSSFAGKGVFSLRGAQSGELLCHFRGTIKSPSAIAAIKNKTLREQSSRYMMCTNDGTCSVPLNRKGSPANYPAAHSGHLINEASLRPEGSYPANVYVSLDGQKTNGNIIFWPVLALRKIVPGEELLLCYGSSYGSRQGYVVDPACS